MNTDIIKIVDLKVFAHHGVFPEETQNGQDFYVSANLYLDTFTASENDDLTKSADYGAVCHFINDYMTLHTFKLIETVANNLAREILTSFPLINAVDIEIKKPHAPIGLPFSNISVKVSAKYHTAYLSIGSNLGDRKAHLDYAIYALGTSKDTFVYSHSSYIETAPVGYLDQPDFLNGAICIKTILTPEELLKKINTIEADEKREREIHWGPRTLDIDILLYDDIIYESRDLFIPHLRMHERSFVLEPLCEIAPNAVHPVLRKTAFMLKEELSNESRKFLEKELLS